MLTVVCTVAEFPDRLLAGWVCVVEVSAFVPPPLPQAATANEINTTRRMPYVTLRDLIGYIDCSCHC
jgi:hypothetical protein